MSVSVFLSCMFYYLVIASAHEIQLSISDLSCSVIILIIHSSHTQNIQSTDGILFHYIIYNIGSDTKYPARISTTSDQHSNSISESSSFEGNLYFYFSYLFFHFLDISSSWGLVPTTHISRGFQTVRHKFNLCLFRD